MNWETVTPPTEGLVPLATAREALSLDPEDDVNDAPSFLVRVNAVNAALDGPDSLTGRCFLRRTVRARWATWAYRRQVPGGSPVELTSAQWYNHLGQAVTVAAGVEALHGRAFVAFGEQPGAYQPGRVVEATYTAGGDAASVPADVQAVALALLRDFDAYQGLILGEGDGSGRSNRDLRAVLDFYDVRLAR